jgi:hypothetical protein
VTIIVTGANGLLGGEICRISKEECIAYPFRLGDRVAPNLKEAYAKSAILCAGRKGFNECDGDDFVFRADVDGNIRLIKALFKLKVFVVFISTEAVERIGHRAAYSSNRLLVEQFLWGQSGNAIIRPGRFDANTVQPLAELCIRVATEKLEGIHSWGHVA